MSTPQGMRAWVCGLADSGQMHIYSNTERIVLQVRRAVPTAEDLLTPSFKAAVQLSAGDALALASELIAAAGRIVEAESHPHDYPPAATVADA
jgi:hypothetical protein